MIRWYAAAAVVACARASTLEALARRVTNDYTSRLVRDPEADAYSPNDRARDVIGGHYVAPLRLAALKRPRLLAVANGTLALLGIDRTETHRAAFAQVFSGGDPKSSALRPLHANAWATPYALSIYGSEQVTDGGVGDGYGDGRAASLCVVDSTWELQLKGSGRTPFARSGDGAAVVRSSTREFLASEAMHALGVPTTRALSLVARTAQKSNVRSWRRRGREADRGDVPARGGSRRRRGRNARRETVSSGRELRRDGRPSLVLATISIRPVLPTRATRRRRPEEGVPGDHVLSPRGYSADGSRRRRGCRADIPWY